MAVFMICYKNGVLQDTIAVQDRAFHYGDGCFTTAKIVNGKIQLWQLHMQRFEKACKELQLQCDLTCIEMWLAKIPNVQTLTGTLKIVLSRGEGQRGYAFPEHAADIWLFVYPSQTISDGAYTFIEQVDLLDSRLGLSMPALVGVKSLNRLEQVMLKQEAQSKGLAEGLVADIHDRIVEGISSNCFMQVNNRWITPNLAYNGVHGIMRDEILARMQQLQIECFEETITIAQLDQINTLFYCNALHPMQIAKQLNNRMLDCEPAQVLFQQLQLNQIDGLWLNP